MTDTLPEGHPLPWDQLVAYEQEQGGYWLYPTGCDVYGNGKLWVRVPRPERPGELDGYANRMYALAKEMKTRGLDTGNRAMADLGADLEGLASQAKDAAEVCGRRRGLIRPKGRRVRPVVPRLKPATVPPAPDTIPGQEALDLFHFEPTLDSI